jgi:hypothetical protein
MARRKLLKIQDREELFGVPIDEDSLIRHYTLSPADRLEIEVRRRKHNQLGFAVEEDAASRSKSADSVQARTITCASMPRLLGQIVKDWTIRTIITLTMRDKVLEHSPHRLKICKLSLQHT